MGQMKFFEEMILALDALLDGRGRNRRAAATSADGGLTWTPATDVDALIEPVCQASLLRYAWSGGDHPGGILLFSNPASTTRDHMTVRASFDDGRTWPVAHLLYEGSSAYSSLVRLHDGRIGLLYERDDYGQIVFTTFPLAWLLEGDSTS
jgi:sialidase-1